MAEGSRALSPGPVVSGSAVDITEKTDCELRDVAQRARWLCKVVESEYITPPSASPGSDAEAGIWRSGADVSNLKEH